MREGERRELVSLVVDALNRVGRLTAGLECTKVVMWGVQQDCDSCLPSSHAEPRVGDLLAVFANGTPKKKDPTLAKLAAF